MPIIAKWKRKEKRKEENKTKQKNNNMPNIAYHHMTGYTCTDYFINLFSNPHEFPLNQSSEIIEVNIH